jgi:hypothetical protein
MDVAVGVGEDVGVAVGVGEDVGVLVETSVGDASATTCVTCPTGVEELPHAVKPITSRHTNRCFIQLSPRNC